VHESWHHRPHSPLLQFRERRVGRISQAEAVAGNQHGAAIAILVIDDEGAAVPLLRDLSDEVDLQLWKFQALSLRVSRFCAA